MSTGASIDLLWLPLGAGGRFVRANGRVYERLAAARARRAPCDLYHAALEVTVDGARWVIEVAPAWGRPAADTGALVTGPVGARRAGRWRLFRYELRCWRDGTIPDRAEAVAGPRRLSDDPAVARRLLALVSEVPPLTWGRDEAGTGDMWNSNSVVAWLLVRSGCGTAGAGVPPGGRAPGWDAGLAQASASGASSSARTRARKAAASAP